MRLLGIEFGGNKPVINQPEKGESDFFVIRGSNRVQKIRQGAELVQIPGKTTIIEKNRVNIDAYRDYIDY
jgi:hypothetical protein